MKRGLLWCLCRRLVIDRRNVQSSGLLFRNAEKELQRFNHLCSYNIRMFCSAEVQRRCSYCQSVLKRRDLFCAGCNYFQEPSEKVNYFELFDHPVQFDIDLSKVTRCYRDLQTRLHPDKAIGMTEKQQKLSGQHSAFVNKAYKTLLNRMERGLYMLELYEMPLRENTVQMEPDFLMHIMEINEKLSSVDDIKALEEISVTNTSTINGLFNEVSRAFQESDTEKARNLLARLKYYYSINAHIVKAEERLGLG